MFFPVVHDKIVELCLFVGKTGIRSWSGHFVETGKHQKDQEWNRFHTLFFCISHLGRL